MCHCSVYIPLPSKPARYGLKVWILCYCGTSYATNKQVYLGKARDGIPEKNQGAQVVKDLCERIHESGRNSTSLAQLLLQKKINSAGHG